jgi:threonine dehydratase
LDLNSKLFELVLIRRLMGAEVIQFGSAWDEANIKANEICLNSVNSAYISPFEHPTIWFVEILYFVGHK